MKQALLCIFLALASLQAAQDLKMNVLLHEGKNHVAASELERHGIAVKVLPGQNELAVCAGELCALVRDHARSGAELLLELKSLASALGAEIELADSGTQATLHFGKPLPEQSPALGIGRPAPDLEFSTLDGRTVRLSDYRGKRVLLNSWASW